MRLEDQAYRLASLLATANATAGTATATVTASTTGKAHCLTLLLLSLDTVSSAIITITLTSGAVALGVFTLPVGAVGPVAIPFARPLQGGSNADLKAVVSTGGTGVKATVNLYGFTATS